MTSEQLEPLRNWFNKRYNALIGIAIFSKHFLLRKRLKVKGASIDEIFLIEGGPFNIRWEVSGCHRIAVNELWSFPGNLKGITYTCVELPQELEIIFYGFDKSIKVMIELPQVYSVKLKNKFYRRLQLPSINCTTFSLIHPTAKYRKDFSKVNRFKLLVPNANLLVVNNPLISTLPKAEIHFPEFTQPNFSNN